ncbi:hypothetical protein HZA76_03475 [Candidatus Roizmanbacteria bacterium]|nr:hypothetical protein [Candidatus Roizmanbacteria bacterium]
MTVNKDKAAEWYKENKYIYELLTKKVESLIREILELNKIDYQVIQSRCKSQSSFENKVDKEGFNYDYRDMQDLAGIRIIGYVKNDVLKISEIIKKEFIIDEKRSIDKSKILGRDKVGYSSLHFVSKFSEERIKLPEYSLFKDIYFEIQIRTILQHAWAEIEHDRNYKFSGMLPEPIQRNFYLISGLLEIADNEFNQISNQIDVYSKDVSNKTKQGNLNIPINSTALTQYFKDTSGQNININFKNGVMSEIIEELNDMDILILNDLDKIFSKRIKNKINEINYPINLNTIIRHVLLADNSSKYFEKAWKKHWTKIRNNEVIFLKDIGVNIEDLSKKYGFTIYFDKKND